MSNKWIWLIALLFFCKFMLLAFWITPLWEVPDETGHFAYARGLAEGKGIPVMGKAFIDSDIVSDARGKEVAEIHGNQIAQHPPLYYYGAGFFWKIGTFLTDDSNLLFKAPRVMSALAGTLTLVVIYFLTVLLIGDRMAGLGVAACVGCIPMFSHLSSGTNNDIMVTLLAALAVYSWVRFLCAKKLRDAYFMAIWLSLACATKMTAFPLVAPMLAVVIIELKLPWTLRVAHMILISFISMLLPALWLLRSFLYLGSPTKVVGGSLMPSSNVQESFIDYISKTDALESIYIHFWGMFGFAGKFRDHTLLRIDGWPLDFFSWVSLLLVLILIFVIVGRFFVMKRNENPVNAASDPKSIIEMWYGLIRKSKAPAIISWLLLTGAVLLGIFAYHFIYSSPGGELRRLFFATGVFALCVSPIVFFKPYELEERLVCYGLLVITFFISVFLCKLYWIYLGSGWARALHGRYFFPLIPVILVAFSLPLIRWQKIPSWVPVLMAAGFALAEMATMLGQAIPFWRNI
jgi:4-amino-4-deoxy-L-arabinose transferase-like glycosyltransferase